MAVNLWTFSAFGKFLITPSAPLILLEQLRSSVLMECPPVQGQNSAKVDISKSDTCWYQVAIIHFVWERFMTYTSFIFIIRNQTQTSM